MPADDRDDTVLAGLLRSVGVALRCRIGGTESVGTGFFAAPGLVVTCAHVVAWDGRTAGTVRGSHEGGELLLEPVRDAVHPEEAGGPDLALLRVVAGRPPEGPCCAALSDAVRFTDPLYAFGFPDHRFRLGDGLRFEMTGPSVTAPVGAGDDGGAGNAGAGHGGAGREEQLKVVGSAVFAGHSGAPVLNFATGCVVGIVRARQDSAHKAVNEARLVRAGRILALFADVRAAQRAWRPELAGWLAALDDEQLMRGGLPYPGPVLRRYLRELAVIGDDDALGSPAPGAPAGMDARYVCRAAERLVGREHVHVVGPPGSGKSALLQRVARRQAKRWLRGRVLPEGVPIYVRATELAPASGWGSLDFPTVLRDAVANSLPHLPMRRIEGEWLRRPPFPGVPWMLLVDALDEVAREKREALFRSLDEPAHDRARDGTPVYCLVLTSRSTTPQERQTLRDVPVLPIDELDDDELRRFLGKHLPHPPRDRATRRAAVDALLAELYARQMLDLARNPLFARLLCAIAAEYGDGTAGCGDAAAEVVGRLPRGRYLLFQEITERLLARAPELPTDDEHPAVALRAVLERTAARQFVEQGGDLWVQAYEEARPFRPAHGVPNREWERRLRATLLATGAVVERGGRAAFVHRSVLEFLAARCENRTECPSPALVPELAARRDDPAQGSFVRFQAAGLVEEHPGVLAAALRIRNRARAREVAALVELLAGEGVPVPAELLALAERAARARSFTEWVGRRDAPHGRPPHAVR